ncbi:uncharacterized protein BT62DRAFT_927190 [Guyanagaster necrorhizus]|uniref:Uncharacterized protein n=1 Tax=Guyanagaster necrorhizus TaxID=856835 RepID=A0A9P7W3F6_9AGAR|nr:uncharacterized protein BT62DRAFT_927190 [Guyanagaster necrorhizus MCA 3950]KAG7451478.1 hypothetical protein BT62DRAFT_927190 [Guyanagaster necrorhizus MCA 3950]
MALEPLLLESFPVPPSFIPPTPTTSINPPPSRPPATPLPPVPGPSRFSFQDSQRILGARDDSLSSISMQDLPSNDDDNDGGDDDLNALTTSRILPSPHSSKSTSTHSFKKITPTRSAKPLSKSTPAIPASNLDRAISPDITTIISRTPKPRRSASTTFSLRSTSTSKALSSASTSRRTSSPIGLPYDRSSKATTWEETDFIDDYGELERELEGERTDSDSSLDLHTPLPHLMVKHGLLSPNSTLLPGAQSINSVDSLLVSEDGVMMDPRASIVSVDTSKSSILKDNRDTPRRRVRHRDGRLLRGGIGLTTGLGWSDSEDEDAPSELTRKISSLNLSSCRPSSTLSEKNLRTVRSSTTSLSWRSTMSSGTVARSSSTSSYYPPPSSFGVSLPRSRGSSSSTSSCNPPPVSLRGFERAFRGGLMKEDELYSPAKSTTSSSPPSMKSTFIDRDKSLPSLPNPKTGSIRRPAKTVTVTPLPVKGEGEGARKRTQSLFTGAPKTLHLPRAVVGRDRPAVPVPRVMGGSLNSKPKPRTGTGMVYRSSGIAL